MKAAKKSTSASKKAPVKKLTKKTTAHKKSAPIKKKSTAKRGAAKKVTYLKLLSLFDSCPFQTVIGEAKKPKSMLKSTTASKTSKAKAKTKPTSKTAA